MNTQSHRAATPRCLMEHRWGARVALDVSVQLQVEGGRIFAGRIRDASISGAFVVCTAGFSPLTSLEVSLEFGGTRLTLPACVLRHAEDGIGIEWRDMASDPLVALLRANQCDQPLWQKDRAFG